MHVNEVSGALRQMIQSEKDYGAILKNVLKDKKWKSWVIHGIRQVSSDCSLEFKTAHDVISYLVGKYKKYNKKNRSDAENLSVAGSMTGSAMDVELETMVSAS